MAFKPQSNFRNLERGFKRHKSLPGRRRFGRVAEFGVVLGSKVWASLAWSLALLGLLGQASLGAAEQETAPLAVQLLTSSVQESRPGLVVLVLDHSGSMRESGGVPPKYSGMNRWQASIADAVLRVDAALEERSGIVDLRVYTFDSQPAHYKSFRSLERLTKQGGSYPAKEYLKGIRLPDTGATALFNSVRNVAEGLVRDDAFGAYSWVWLVLYSDGDDTESGGLKSQRRAQAEGGMCEALNRLSQDPRVVIDYLPIGNGVTLLNPNCGGLRRSTPGEVKRPMIYQLSATPDPIQLKGAGVLATSLQWKGPFPADKGAIRFDLAGQPPGLSVARDSSQDRLIWTVPDTLADGVQFSMVVSIPHPDGGQRILSVTNEVRVPPLEMPPQIGGLPPPCAEDGGARVLLSGRGEVVEIQPVLPNDVVVRWVVSPGGEIQNSPVFRKEGLQSGRYEVSVTASRGSKKVSDKVVLYVIEPEVEIRAATAGGQPVVGDSFDLIAVPQGNSLPEFLRKRLSSVEQAWMVAGRKQESKGMSLRAVFRDFGKLPVDFNAVLDPCDSKGGKGTVKIHGSKTFEIKAGVSIEDLTGSLVEGYPGAVKVDVSDRDLVDHVEISVDGGRNWRSTRFEDSTRQHAEAISDPPFAWKDMERLVETRPSGERFLKVLERPIRKLPDGTVSKRDDPKNQERQKNVDIPVIKPNVELSVGGSVSDGAEVAVGRALKLQAEVSGAHGNLVKRVEVRIKSGAPAQRLGDMTQGDKPANSNSSSTWWSEAFKPSAEMGKDVILEFVAFDGDGGALKSFSIKVRPTPPKPVLVSSQGQVIRWSGGPENVPTVIVNLLESGTKEPFPAKDVVSIQWKVTGALELVSQPGDRSQTASFRPVRRGDATLEAVVQLGTLGAQSATLLLKVDPVPMTEENKPQLDVVQSGSRDKRLGKGEEFWLRGGHMLDLQLRGEVGAFQERRIELIRGGETNVVASDKGISFAGVRPSWALWKKAKPLPCAVKISWVAWGEPGSSAVVRQESFDAVAAAPVSAWIALPVAALILIYICMRLGFRNSLLGQWVQWETQPHKRDLSRFPIGVFSGTSFNLWLGCACLRIPKKPRASLGMPDPLAWMDRKILSTDRIIFPQLKDGKFPNRLSSRNTGLKASLSNQVSGGVYQVVPSNPANNPQPIFFIISDGIGEMNRALIALLSLGLILLISAGCVFQLVWCAWPQS